MENIEKKEKKKSSEEKIYERLSEKYIDIKSSKSNFYYASLIILNICILLLTMLWLNNTEGIEPFSIVADSISYEIIILMLIAFIIIMLLHTLTLYLKLYNKTKSSKFGMFYKANSIAMFYDCVTNYSRGGLITSINYMTEHKVSINNAVDIAYSKKIFYKISYFIYSFIFLLLALFLWIDEISVWLFLIAFVSFLVNLSVILLVWLFNSNKQSALSLISWICKFLYNRRFIKDYEVLYDKIIDTLIVYNKAFKQSRVLIITEIASNLLIIFLRSLILYFALFSMNFGNVEVLGSLLFRFLIIDMIISILPLQKGTLISEILFIYLFKDIFFSGFSYWGLMIYKIFEYFIYIFQFLIVLLIEKISSRKNQVA